VGADGDDADIQAMIDARAEAKRERDFARADEIRDELSARGIAIEDGPDGTTWRRLRDADE
jgi:cysteinyl-tRNA synthetase